MYGYVGEKSGIKELVKWNIKVFENLNIDYIIMNVGGCGVYFVDYDYFLKDDLDWVECVK